MKEGLTPTNVSMQVKKGVDILIQEIKQLETSRMYWFKKSEKLKADYKRLEQEYQLQLAELVRIKEQGL